MDDLAESLTRNRPRYEAYAPKLRELVEVLLTSEGIVTQSVTVRVKTQTSALAKAGRPGQAIATAVDLHDFLGLRVITYFADQVETVARLFRDNFDVDESRTKHRRDSLDPDRFGYLSMHLSSRLHVDRRKLPEWQPFEDIPAEVQIRSSLQHSWAEIEHDLGYKTSGGSIPAKFRRRFSRLAGLLELADDEFIALRDGLSAYSAEMADDLESGRDAPIDQASVHAFVLSNPTLADVDQAIADGAGVPNLENATPEYSGWRASELQRIGYTSIRDVERRLKTRKSVLEALGAAWLSTAPSVHGEEEWPDDDHDAEGRWVSPLGHGIGLFYLYLDHLADGGVAGLEESPLMNQSGPGTAEQFLALRSRVEGAVEGRQ